MYFGFDSKLLFVSQKITEKEKKQYCAMPPVLSKVVDETVAAANPSTANEEETASKRKQDFPIVSPGKKKQKNDGQETIDKYYEKELNPSKYLKSLEMTAARNLLKENPVVVTIRDVAYGMWSFIQVNNFGTNDEPNTIQCLYHALGFVSYTKAKRNPLELDFAKEINVLCAAPRRLSWKKDQPIFKPSRGSQTALEKEAEFVCNKIKTHDLKKAKLERIAEVSQNISIPVELNTITDTDVALKSISISVESMQLFPATSTKPTKISRH